MSEWTRALKHLTDAEREATEIAGARPTIDYLLFLAWTELHGGNFLDSPAKQAISKALDLIRKDLDNLRYL